MSCSRLEQPEPSPSPSPPPPVRTRNDIMFDRLKFIQWNMNGVSCNAYGIARVLCEDGTGDVIALQESGTETELKTVFGVKSVNFIDADDIKCNIIVQHSPFLDHYTMIVDTREHFNLSFITVKTPTHIIALRVEDIPIFGMCFNTTNFVFTCHERTKHSSDIKEKIIQHIQKKMMQMRGKKWILLGLFYNNVRCLITSGNNKKVVYTGEPLFFGMCNSVPIEFSFSDKHCVLSWSTELAANCNYNTLKVIMEKLHDAKVLMQQQTQAQQHPQQHPHQKLAHFIQNGTVIHQLARKYFLIALQSTNLSLPRKKELAVPSERIFELVSNKYIMSTKMCQVYHLQQVLNYSTAHNLTCIVNAYYYDDYVFLCEELVQYFIVLRTVSQKLSNRVIKIFGIYLNNVAFFTFLAYGKTQDEFLEESYTAICEIKKYMKIAAHQKYRREHLPKEWILMGDFGVGPSKLIARLTVDADADADVDDEQQQLIDSQNALTLSSSVSSDGTETESENETPTQPPLQQPSTLLQQQIVIKYQDDATHKTGTNHQFIVCTKLFDTLSVKRTTDLSSDHVPFAYCPNWKKKSFYQSLLSDIAE